MASYVIIWENNTLGHRRVANHMWAGHASLHIGDYFWQAEAPNYVSFWPKYGADLSVGGIILDKKVEGTAKLTVMADVAAEEYLPDHIIRLPSTEEAETRMKGEWKSILTQNNGKPQYAPRRQNCSTVVSRVLHAGGFYAQKWALNNNLIWTPGDIRRLCCDIHGAVMVTWSEFHALIQRETGKEDPFWPTDMARSGCYCTTGAPVEHQTGEKFTGWDEEFKGPTGTAA